jgi:hypothetical protein
MTSEFYNPSGTYSEGTEGNKVMSSDDYYSLEFSDDYLDSQAEAGDCLLDESGFYFRLNAPEISKLVSDGQHWLVLDKRGHLKAALHTS